MGRKVLNKILIVGFVLILCCFGAIYLRQERTMNRLDEEYASLQTKAERVEYVIGEYELLLDNAGSRDFVIRWAREILGWVFDGEVVYRPNTSAPETEEPEAAPQETAAPEEQ